MLATRRIPILSKNSLIKKPAILSNNRIAGTNKTTFPGDDQHPLTGPPQKPAEPLHPAMNPLLTPILSTCWFRPPIFLPSATAGPWSSVVALMLDITSRRFP